MSRWRLTRQNIGDDSKNSSTTFVLNEGDEITIGRALENTINITSIVISRKHCVLKVHHNKIYIEDSKSANGVYVGINKIPPQTQFELHDSDIIGLGWTERVSLTSIADEEKCVFKVTKEANLSSSANVIESGKVDPIEEKDASLDVSNQCNLSSVNGPKLSLKRKSEVKCEIIKKEKKCPIVTIDDDIVDLLSDNDDDLCNKDILSQINNEGVSKNEIKTENQYLKYEAFNVKQEYLGYDDEPIKIDSDSDSETEHWYIRLSQNSPGKPFVKLPKDREEMPVEDSSYSQMDDSFISATGSLDNEEEFIDDIIKIPMHPHDLYSSPERILAEEEFVQDIITFQEPASSNSTEKVQSGRDEVDNAQAQQIPKQTETSVEPAKIASPLSNKHKSKAQMIDALVQLPKGRSKHHESKSSSSLTKHSKVSKYSSKRNISDSQKEERKKKLKALAFKGKEADEYASSNTSNNSLTKPTPNVKITSSNRGAFLTSSVQVVKPVKRKEETKETKTICNSSGSSPILTTEKQMGSLSPEDRENKKKPSKKVVHKSSKHRIRPVMFGKNDYDVPSNGETKVEDRVPLKSLKPLSGSEETYSGKPVSKVDPLPAIKPKKTVRFSDTGPQIHFFEIEPGNKLKRTSLVKKSLVDIRQMPVFSLEKITLMKILRWNPNWLEEQINNDTPPPILGHNNPPMSVLHLFMDHNQYVQLIGDLLLMEIWECLTLAYMKIRCQAYGLEMRIGSLPPIPTQERCYELYSLSVNISLPSHDTKNVPRMGEVLLVTFGPENAKIQRFFFVNNVRSLPSPPNNIHSFYSISLHTTYTDKMKSLRLGEVMMAKTLAYINKELNLFEAMEYLAGSPLSDAILRPEPKHFQKEVVSANDVKSTWMKALNYSQQSAVKASVAAALGDKPKIQMVQGPPGTGKSSVICAIAMTYFYNEDGKRHSNRAKILICATSNAAVDELVIRLLNIRQNLPKSERFRMVRVGRAEAMAPRARDVSSQQLATRDAQRLQQDPQPRSGLKEEISHLEAKINMWKTLALDAKDPVRIAYCQGRLNDLQKRLALVRTGSGGGDELRPDQLSQAERRIIEGADIVVTTLASAHNHKMRGLKRRIALCIIDEAGQAIEPETLIPLTLDVTKITLIGDPQQLPGFICSQRAKKYGLGESLFSRLTSSSESWPTNPVALLDRQYRMHPHIADYPNRAFYNSRVKTQTLPRPEMPLPPYSILSISSGDKGQGAAGANEMEAWGVSRLVVAINTALKKTSLSIAVITPYNAHKELIKKNLKLLMGSDPPVEVNTVDSFQGQERDVVVVSLARSQGVGFLTDPGRMNVMLTRAKHALLICLNPLAMMRNRLWRTLIEDAQKRKMYMLLPNNMCQPVTPQQAATDDILKYLYSAK